MCYQGIAQTNNLMTFAESQYKLLSLSENSLYCLGVNVVGKKSWIEKLERIFQNSTFQLHIPPAFLMDHGEV